MTVADGEETDSDPDAVDLPGSTDGAAAEHAAPKTTVAARGRRRFID
jgi:hypothetical protein